MTVTIAGVTYGQMADSITPGNLLSLPFQPDALLGYVDGRWPDYLSIAAQHPGASCFGLTVFGSLSVGDGVDCEWGDASPWQAAQAVKAELARGVDRPILYCPMSWAAQCAAACNALGIDRSLYRLLTAHYGGFTMPGGQPGEHICGPNTCKCPVQADGTQWNSYPAYDISLLNRTFLVANPYPGPPPGPSYPQGAPIMASIACSGFAGTPTGKGYWQSDASGVVRCFGDAQHYGDMGGKPLNKPLVGMARTASGDGYWLVASDGGIFTFGDAAFHGSTGNITLNEPIIGMLPTPDGGGYWLIAGDGGVFTFGSAAFYGSGA